MNLNSILPITAIASLAFGAVPAMAEPITFTAANVGSTYTAGFNGFSGSTTVDGLTAQVSLTLTSVSSTSYTFSYAVTNTTSDPVNSRVSSFGFNTNPDISGASSTGTYSYVVTDANVPNGIGTIDVCFKGAFSNSCSGSGGVTDGQTGTGSLTLTFSQPLTALTLDDFFVRYQSITGAGNITSATGTVTGSTSSSTGGTQVPEPGVIGLLGGALIAMGLVRRRRTVRAAAPAFG